MLIAIVVIFGISVLVLIHELGHFIAAKQEGLLVEEFGFGFPPRMFSKKVGETVYSFNWLPFGGFVKIYGERSIESGKSPKEVIEEERGQVELSRSFSKQSIWKRVVIVGAGISINFLFGWFLLSLIFMIGAPSAVVVGAVVEGSPAEEAGIKFGDTLVDFENSNEFVAFSKANAGKEIEVKVQRGAETVAIKIIGRVDVGPDEGPLGVVLSDAGFERVGFFKAIWQGLYSSILTMGEVLKAFGGLITQLFSRGSIPDNIVGPVGIFSIAGQLGNLGFIYIVQLLALISLNLAILNAIPFPALDGGRILFLLIEKFKGSPIKLKTEIWANALSFVFLFLLMIVITGRDIINLF